MTAAELLPQIKPRNARVSDKYSANLYRFIRERRLVTVLFHKPSGQRYLTCSNWREDDWPHVTGARIWHVLIATRRPEDCTAVYVGHLYADCEDITEVFWREYIRKGRCALDPEHERYFQGDEDRFSMIASARRCNWCGLWFRKEVEKVVEIKRITHWVPVERVAPHA